MLRSTRMPRRILLSAVAVTAVMAFAPANVAHADGAYQYKVLPGSAAWAKLKTHQQMVEAVQIPAATIRQMSTGQLADAVLDYPLLPDALAFNDVQQGVEVVAGRFDGLRELLRRRDAGTVLLDRYRRLDVRTDAAASELQAGNHTLEVWKVETLLAQPQVLASLPAGRVTELLRVGLDKYQAKQVDAAVYGQAGLEPTAVVLGRALAVREGWDWRKSGFLRSAVESDGSGTAATVEAVREHLADPSGTHQVTDGVTTLDHSSTVYTPRGTAVPVITITSDLTSTQKAANDRYVRDAYPQATLERGSTRKYNCHSYAWYSTATTNDRWMNTPGDDKYWQDGSYTQWHPPYTWFSGMRINYPEGDHSGIWVGTSNNVRSKWGQYGQLHHAWNYSPYTASVTNSYFRT